MPLDLRRRLAAALIGLSVGLAGLFALALWVGTAWFEGATLDRVLGREMALLIESRAAPAQLDAQATGLRYYRPSLAPPPAPENLQALAPGSYRDFALPDGKFHVLVREIAPGDRAYLLYDVAAFASRERWLTTALIAGVLAAALAAWLVSGRISRRALAPLEALVARIRALDPARRGQRIESWAEDGDLDVIVAALNEHMARIDALIARERAFAAAASHELRTPLAAVRGAAEVLAVVPSVPKEVLERIERAVLEATADLDALLALSQSREPPLAEPLRLDQLLSRLATAYAPQARENETRVRWARLEKVELSAPRGVVSIIFTNLLRNAIRAAPGGEVRLHLDAQSFAVVDDGEGMTPEQLAQAFEPGAKGRHGGSGMGLYISQALAQRCGWKLTLESRSGEGTVARLSFAASAAQLALMS